MIELLCAVFIVIVVGAVLTLLSDLS